jgi:peroxiredoxin (alkyl hydroperoxide reductase subunit C)
MRRRAKLTLVVVAACASLLPAFAQVLGPCGTAGENEATAASEPATATGAPVADRIPLPGQRALNFELQAVVGDEIKMIKLSDYNDKWRVLCFYPADFTFV